MNLHSTPDYSASLVRVGAALGVAIGGLGLLTGSQVTVGLGLVVLAGATYGAMVTGNRVL